jgi:hypothetical protein
MDESKVADKLEPSVAEHHEKEHARHYKGEALHEHTETEGYVIDVEGGEAGEKLAKDGHTRLIPQPSDDPNDPLNWSWGQKHLVLFIVSLTAFLPDYGSATGAVTLIAQAAYVLPVRRARAFHMLTSTWTENGG